MGRYLSINLSYDGYGVESTVLRGAFLAKTFRPKGMGALALLDYGDKWFLSGYGLESFVSHFGWRGAGKQPLISFAKQHNPASKEYQESVCATVKRRLSTSSLSEFETKYDELGLTLLNSPDLRVENLAAFREWSSHTDGFFVHLYGTFALSADLANSLDLTHAFRFLFPTTVGLQSAIGAPFLLIAARSDAKRRTTDVTLFSESTIWLRDCNALGGKVAPTNANENLARLAELVDSFVRGEGRLLHADLHLESSTFQNEAPRIRDALGHLIDERKSE